MKKIGEVKEGDKPAGEAKKDVLNFVNTDAPAANETEAHAADVKQEKGTAEEGEEVSDAQRGGETDAEVVPPLDEVQAQVGYSADTTPAATARSNEAAPKPAPVTPAKVSSPPEFPYDKFEVAKAVGLMFDYLVLDTDEM